MKRMDEIKIKPNDDAPRKRTNAERIRSMNDEELAAFITDDLCELLCGAPLSCDGQCDAKLLDWLKEEAKE